MKKDIIKSYNGKRALLVGNGVNRLDEKQSISWKELLQALQNNLEVDLKIETDLDNKFKPFPLGFEEMLHRTVGKIPFEDKIKRLKKKIRENIDHQLKGKEGFNKYHRFLMSLPYDDYLTTNYDYALEISSYPNFIEEKNNFAENKQEPKHSLRRRYFLENKRVWHIHGELEDSRNLSDDSKYYHEESIMIGYEHYSSYLEQIQANIKGSSKKIDEPEKNSLMVRIINRQTKFYWLDMFFTHNLDIVGLGLDFSENHLWWLLNLRANYIRKENRDKDRVIINNKIRYFYPVLPKPKSQSASLEDLENYKNENEKGKAIGDVLKAFQVDVISLECNTHEDFYEQLEYRLS